MRGRQERVVTAASRQLQAEVDAFWQLKGWSLSQFLTD
jgi:hypothetical protein